MKFESIQLHIKTKPGRPNVSDDDEWVHPNAVYSASVAVSIALWWKN
jgi:hypothetical protein